MQSSTPPNQPRHRHDHHHHLRHHDNLRLGLDTDPSNPSTSLALSLHNPNANPNANPTADPARSSSPSTSHHHGSIISNQPCNAQLPSWAAFHPHNHNSSSPSQTPQAMALQNRSSSFSPSLSAPPPPPPPPSRPSGSHHLMHLSSSRFDDQTPAAAGDSYAAPPLIPLELLPLRPSNNPSASMATPSLASHSAPQSAASFFWHPPPPPPPPPAPSMAVPPPSPSPSPAIPSQAAMPAIFSMSAHMPFPLNNLIPAASHSPSPSLSPSPSPKLLLRRGLDMNQPPQYVGGDHEEASLDLDYAGEVGQRTSESNNCLNVKRDRERSDGVLSDGAEHEDRTCEVSSRGSDEDIDVGGGGGSSRARKKLRLTKEQSTLLEESFKEHSTLNPKQKAELAKKLSLRPRQVEVWFQNRRARTKLKQTEVDCELLKRCCESLTEENRRLKKEVAELRAMKVGPPCVIARDLYMPLPAATLTMCPSCERLATHTSSGSAPAPAPGQGPGSGPGPAVAPISSAPPSQSSPKENQHQQSFNHMMAAAASNLKAALHNTPPSQSPSNLNHASPNPIAMSNGNPGNSINTTNHNNSRSSSPNPGMAAVAVSPPTTTAAATAASNSSNAAHFSQYRFSQPPPLPSAAC